VLGEVDVLGKGRTVVGLNLLRAQARNGDRTLIGPYARLGFGRWGFLAEHDMTERSVKTASTPVTFWQSKSCVLTGRIRNV
jgi:hypothetical protein